MWGVSTFTVRKSRGHKAKARFDELMLLEVRLSWLPISDFSLVTINIKDDGSQILKICFKYIPHCLPHINR